jgi:hypothetical protein
MKESLDVDGGDEEGARLSIIGDVHSSSGSQDAKCANLEATHVRCGHYVSSEAVSHKCTGHLLGPDWRSIGDP